MANKDDWNSDDKLVDYYHKKFKGEDYAEQYYKNVDVEYRFFMTNYFNYFSKEIKKDSVQQLLDFGCGPVPIYAATAAAASFHTTITMCDLLENNRNIISKFMQTTDGALLWEPHFNYLEKISNKRSSDIVKDLRAAFKEAVAGDVHIDMPIPGKKNYFDVILTNLALEYACVDAKHMKRDIKNLSNMLKPGGILMQGGALEINSYYIKEEKFPAVYLTTDMIKEMFKDPDMGIQLLELNTLKVDDRAGKATDHNGVFFLVAQKMGKDVANKILIEGHLEQHQI